MDASLSKSLESQFGPPSELIHVGQFMQNAYTTGRIYQEKLDSQRKGIPEQQETAPILECSVDDLKQNLDDTWANPTLSSFLLKEHDRIVTTLAPTVKLGRAHRKAYFPAPDTLPSDTRALYDAMNGVKLNSWTWPSRAGLFTRTSRNADQNAYDSLALSEPTIDNTTVNVQGPKGLLVLTVYCKVPHSPCYVARLSQHAFLSTQTLANVCTTVPCPPYAARQPLDPSNPFFDVVQDTPTSGCVVCIEGLVYGDGTDNDYADKVLAHLSLSPGPSKDHNLRKAEASLSSTPLSSLSLRINEPYWMLHKGNCEHFLVVEQIRLLHPSDPPSGYPITTQLTPRLLDICRACGKSPATWSIVGDIRLGESPMFMCDWCWKTIGLPDGDDLTRIEVIPLV